MERFELRLKRSVRKDLRSIPQQDVHRILEKLEELRADPRPPGSIKLTAREYYRLRVGNYRILYEIQDAILLIVVIKVAHRSTAYR